MEARSITGRPCRVTLAFSVIQYCSKVTQRFPPTSIVSNHQGWIFGLVPAFITIREAPFNKSPPLFGHCPNSIYTPPPHSNGHSGALFFRRDFTILPFLPFFLPFSLNKCPKPSGQGFRPPQNQANAHLNLENSSLKKCPKPSGQGFRPPPPYGQCPNRGDANFKGASLTQYV